MYPVQSGRRFVGPEEAACGPAELCNPGCLVAAASAAWDIEPAEQRAVLQEPGMQLDSTLACLGILLEEELPLDGRRAVGQVQDW